MCAILPEILGSFDDPSQNTRLLTRLPLGRRGLDWQRCFTI